MSPKKIKRFLWITDPWSTLDHKNDTTLRLAEESIREGHQSYWCDYKSIYLDSTGTHLSARPVMRGSKLGKLELYSPLFFDFIHYRVDPPVDLNYLSPLKLLNLEIEKSNEKTKTQVVNSATLLQNANEKLESQLIPDLAPRTVVSSSLKVLEAFGKSEKKVILKPLHDAQSRGIELLQWTSPSEIKRSKKLIHSATSNFKTPILLQEYLPGIKEGEVRLWFVDGELIGFVRKHPLPKTFKVDIDRGSMVTATSLSTREKRVVLKIGKHLKKKKIRMAAVDLIDEKVTDLNFTSPGLIVQMEKVLKTNLAKRIISVF